MDYGICNLTSIPLRASASHKSEMVSQLLFGECYSILGKSDGWFRISTTDCNYEGWIQDKQAEEISSSEFENLSKANKLRVIEPLVQKLWKGSPVLTMGACINGNITNIDSSSLMSAARLSELSLNEKKDFVLKSACKLLDTPYLWGGRTPLGIDCSGLVQIVFSLVGVTLPRDASQQVLSGTQIDFAVEGRAGDLAFFSNDEGAIVHVGILSDNSEIIHASGKVRIDTLDETGIFNKGTGKYTHNLRVIKRIL